MTIYFDDIKEGLIRFIMSECCEEDDLLTICIELGVIDDNCINKKYIVEYIEKLPYKKNDVLISCISHGMLSDNICKCCRVKYNYPCFGAGDEHATIMCQDALEMYVEGEHDAKN